jgi:hypothetical protein
MGQSRYDITPGDQSKWIRLRDADDEITLTVKQITSDAIDGTHEIEVSVDDFAATNALLGVLGFNAKSYQETKRTSFILDGAQVEIDTWPQIPALPGNRRSTHATASTLTPSPRCVSDQYRLSARRPDNARRNEPTDGVPAPLRVGHQEPLGREFR